MESIQSVGAGIVRKEAEALMRLADSLDTEFAKAVELISKNRGRLIICGIGKSGHIGKKIAATFASTGTPSFFVHPAEASHGDLGMIDRSDVVLAISKSGESAELADIITYCHRFAIQLIGITAKAGSSLGKAADVLLLLPDLAEACPLGLAPTSSTTMTLAMGDALAVASMHERNFEPAQFRTFHPGGKLGQKLMRARDVMHEGESLPLLNANATVGQAALEMSKGRFGCVGIIDEHGELSGIFTDGDLRRHFNVDNFDVPISRLMTPDPRKLDPDALVADVMHTFSQYRIPSAFVCVDRKPVGIIHIHDLVQKGFV